MLRLKSLRWFWWVLVAAAAAAVLVGGFVAVQYATAAAVGPVQPADGAFLPSSTVVVSVGLLGHRPRAEEVELLIDARPVPSDRLELLPDAVRATVTLRDGRHWARLTLTSRNLFSRRLVRSWTFTVDTTEPSVVVEAPRPREAFSEPHPVLSLRFREPVQARLWVDGREIPLEASGQAAAQAATAAGQAASAASASGQAAAAQAATAALDLSEGRHRLAVTVIDLAGNTATESWEAWADFSAPRVRLSWWPAGTWRVTSARLVVEVTDNQPEGVTVAATVDGRPLAVKTGAVRQEGVRTYSFSTGALAEGRHVLDLTVSDRAGNSFRHSDEVVVDSTEVFGFREMTAGAQGRDVQALQQVLIRKGLLAGAPTGAFDEATAAAVRRFREDRGLDPAPLLDQAALAHLVGSVRIDLSERKLYLYDEGRLVKTYRVAVGQPRYPTPTGRFAIVEKVYHPAWNPPPSPWAAGLEPVPPGPGNPLGTRWMGLSAPHVGIHGTYAAGSIGTAASHGCIRMHISDSEELFELVFVGTPVEIVP